MKTLDQIKGQDKVIAEIRHRLKQKTFEGAFLFYGPPGVGKYTTALAVAAELLCRNRDEQRLLEAGNHPNLILLSPGESGSIKINEARELIRRMNLKPSAADRNVAVIDECDTLTPEAANALLKTIEEPPAHASFILLTSAPGVVPATIRSRCQILRFTPLSIELLRELLCGLIECPETSLDDVLMSAEGSLKQALIFVETLQDLKCSLPELLEKLAVSPYRELADLINELPQDAENMRCIFAGLRVVCRELLLQKQTLATLRASLGPEILFAWVDALQEAEQALKHHSPAPLIWEALAFSIQKMLGAPGAAA